MPSADFGFFRPAGSHLAGSIGKLRADWDRQRGGVQSVRFGRRGALRLAARVRLLKDARPILVRQEDDPDPRLVICEEGPERIALRVMFSLVDEDGTYHGDGLTDTVLYADGEVQLAFALRLVDDTVHDTVTDAWIEATTDEPVLSARPGAGDARALDAADLAAGRRRRFGRGLPGRCVTLAARRGATAFAWYGNDGKDRDRLGGVGLWHGAADRPPYYDTWGHLYGQWKGLSGWGAHQTGRLSLDAQGDGARLGWHWLSEANEPCGAALGMRALLGVFFGKDDRAVRRRVAAMQRPLVPRAEGAQFRCLDLVENALLYRMTGPSLELVFPPDPLERTARVRVFDVDGSGAVIAAVNGRRTVPQVLSLGGQTDDPYGPNLARPGDRFVPVTGDPGKGPCQVVMSVPLSRSRRTVATLSQGPGLNLAYLKWDDRQTYVVRASTVPARPPALFSTQTLCLHDLRGVRGGEPALVRVPLYWYPCNVPTRGECFNRLERLRVTLRASGDIALRVTATDPNARARSTVTAELPRPDQAVVVRAHARLDVLTRLNLPAIQYLNSFPANSWQPEDWESDWVLLMGSDGRRTWYPFKERRPGRGEGDDLRRWTGRLFFAQGAADRGNIFILAQSGRPARQPHGYMLCPVWLDSHFTIEQLKTPVEAGASFEAGYTIAIHGDRRLARAEAEAIGERTLLTGELPLA